MITIHGSSVSPFVRKTLVCLIEKGVDYNLNPISPFPPPEDFLQISPLGKIPAMTDGDLAIPDSSAICGYIEKKYPEHPLYPSEPGDYGRALWFEDWADNELPKATAALFFNRIAVKMMKREPDEAVIQKILDDVQPPIFAYLEAQIGNKTYLVGDAFSIADIAVTSQFIQMLYAGESLPAEQFPNITRYVTELMHRDSFKGLVNNDPFIKIQVTMSKHVACLVFIISAAFSPFALAENAVLAGGCFWCMEKDFEELEGVTDVISGFTGGTAKNPTYRGDHTGHYEAVEITYDPDVLSYEDILNHFWINIDPFDAQGQFCDKGPSYLSAIFVANEAERAVAEKTRQAVVERFPDQTVVTPILPAATFYPIKGAEIGHQDFYKKNPLRYAAYRWGCGRDQRLAEIWGPK